jgi:hypothetical protein
MNQPGQSTAGSKWVRFSAICAASSGWTVRIGDLGQSTLPEELGLHDVNEISLLAIITISFLKAETHLG